jgi:hypothetical protein
MNPSEEADSRRPDAPGVVFSGAGDMLLSRSFSFFISTFSRCVPFRLAGDRFTTSNVASARVIHIHPVFSSLAGEEQVCGLMRSRAA